MIRRLFFVLAAVCSLTGPAQAGPWLPVEDHGLVDVTYTDYRTTDIFDQNGTRQPLNGEFRSGGPRVYGEHGIGPSDAIVYSGGISALRRDSTLGFPTLTNSGLGDVMVGWKHLLGAGPNHAHAFELDVSVPTGYDPNAPLPLGFQSLDTTATLQSGYTWEMGSGWGYVDGYVGYRVRGGAPVDQFLFGGGVGVPVVEPVLIYARVDGVRSQSAPVTPLGPSLLANSYDITQGTLGLNFTVSDAHSVHVDRVQDLSGRNSGAGGAWRLGFTARY